MPLISVKFAHKSWAHHRTQIQHEGTPHSQSISETALPETLGLFAVSASSVKHRLFWGPQAVGCYNTICQGERIRLFNIQRGGLSVRPPSPAHVRRRPPWPRRLPPSAAATKVSGTVPADEIQATIDPLKKLRRQYPVQRNPRNHAAGILKFIAQLIPVLMPFLYSFGKAIGDFNRAECAAAAKISRNGGSTTSRGGSCSSTSGPVNSPARSPWDRRSKISKISADSRGHPLPRVRPVEHCAEIGRTTGT